MPTTDQKSRWGPEFADFLDGFPGPAAAPYPGAELRIPAILVYADGLRIDWRMRPMPDLSWVPIDEEEATKHLPDEWKGTPAAIARHLELMRLSELWKQSTVIDERGNAFQLSPYSRTSSIDGGFEGDVSCACSVLTAETRSFSLRLPASEILVPLAPRDDQASTVTFRGGYPGPSSPLPFHGGAIKVIAALVYADKVVIEWLARPVPDVAWVAIDEELFNEWLAKIGKGREAAMRPGLREYKQLVAMWNHATLTDKRRTYYVPGQTHSRRVFGGGHKGETVFRPGPPIDASELHLTLDQLSVFIPLQRPWGPVGN